MASGGNEATLDTVSMALRAVNRLSKDPASPADIHTEVTPATLASAIKLASLSSEHQKKLTPTNVNHAVKLAKHQTLEKLQVPAGFTMESLAIALKVVLQSPPSEPGKPEAIKVSESNPAAAAFRTAVVFGSLNQHHEPVTSNILANALQLAKK